LEDIVEEEFRRRENDQLTLRNRVLGLEKELRSIKMYVVGLSLMWVMWVMWVMMMYK